MADLPSPESLPRYLELGDTGEPEMAQDTFSGDEATAPAPSGGRLGWGHRPPSPDAEAERAPGSDGGDALAAHEAAHSAAADPAALSPSADAPAELAHEATHATEAEAGSTDHVEILEDEEADIVMLDDAETAAAEVEGEAPAGDAEAEGGSGSESEETVTDEEHAEEAEREASAEGGASAEVAGEPTTASAASTAAAGAVAPSR